MSASQLGHVYISHMSCVLCIGIYGSCGLYGVSESYGSCGLCDVSGSSG